MRFPDINKADFIEEWDKFPNKISVEVIKEPPEHVRPGECIAFKIKLVKFVDQSEIQIRSASFYRLIGNNGIVFNLKLQEGQVFLLLRLVIGDVELILHQPDETISNVMQTHEYIKNKNSSAYYRPKAHSVFNTPLGVYLSKNQLDLFVKIMVASPEDQDGPAVPFRILFNTVNNEENDFSITRKFISSEFILKPVRKYIINEMLDFFKEFDTRNFSVVEKIQKIEKLNREVDKIIQNNLIKDIVMETLDSIPGITSKQNYNGKTILCYLSALGLNEIVKIFINKMKLVEINLLDVNTRTALFYAVESGHKGVVKTLLSKGATWHTKDTRGETVTDFALRGGYINILNFLNDVKQNKLNEHNNESNLQTEEPKIHQLILKKNNFEELKKTIAILKRKSISPNSSIIQTTLKGYKKVRPIDVVNDDGATALHIAAANGKKKAVNLLISSLADVNAKDDDESTPLHQAIASRKIKCVKALLNAEGIDLEARDSTLSTPLILASLLNIIEVVKLLIEKKASFDAGDERDFTPLHHACSYGYFEIVQILLEAGADPNRTALIDDTTPFHQAVLNGHHELIDILIKYGADPSFGNNKALNLACENGHTMCVQMLLDNNCDPNCKDDQLSTPAHKAALNGHLGCLQLLKKASADIFAKDNEGSTPLHKAAFSGRENVVEYLLLLPNPPVNEIDNYNGTALHNASFCGHAESVRLLVNAGSIIELEEDLGSTAIHLAALNGHFECVKNLVVGLEANGNLEFVINKKDHLGMTALMYSVPYPDMVKFLCEKGVLPNLQDNEGKSAFFHSIIKRYEISARILIEIGGADPLLKNKLGQIPLQMVSEEFKDMIQDAVRLRKGVGDVELTKKWEQAVDFFNIKPIEGINYASKNGLIENSPDGVALFLHKENALLNPKFMGELLSHRDQTALLYAFVKRLNFENMGLDEAIRQFLQYFLLPGEAELIDRLMEALATRYVENNPNSFPNKDTAFIFAFGIIMLNTDAHNPNIPPDKKMTKNQYIKNHRTLWGPDGQDPPQELMESIYDRIVMEEIKFRDNGIVNEKEGNLRKQGRNFGSWQNYWFSLKDQCLFYYKNKSDSEPLGLIPLENVIVKKKNDKKPTKKIKLVASDGGPLKSCKLNKSNIVQGSINNLNLMAEKPEEAEQWIKAINSQIASNPFYNTLSIKSEQLAEKQRAKGALYGVGAIVNFHEFYGLILLCQSCYSTENQIKKQYGTSLVILVSEVRGVKFFLLYDQALQKYHLILGGNLWTEKTKVAEWDQFFDWKDHFTIDQTVESILDIIEDKLEIKNSIQITGHSLGGLLAVFIAIALKQRSYKLVKITTFGQPNFMSENNLQLYLNFNVIRIIDIHDPADSIFAGYYHFGHLITILNKNNFCYENKVSAKPEIELTNKDLKNSKTSREPSWKQKRNLKTGVPIDSSLQFHTIDYYIKRLKTKLKVETQYIEPSQKNLYC